MGMVGRTMQYRFHAEEWHGLSRVERVARCRVMAQEANKLAQHATREETKRRYVDLALQWEGLARDMETDGASNGSSQGDGAARSTGSDQG